MNSIVKLLIAIAAVFAPIQGMLGACLALILVDLVSGVIAARKRNEPISSAGVRRTITKLFVYELAIMLGFLTQHYLMNDSLNIVNIISGFIGMTELMSVMENMNSASGGDLLKKLLELLGSANQPKKD